jgi:cyclopropane fatty-acyl-phospholipid synthase-like methyltransferase
MDFYILFFNKCASWLRKGGRLILHTGKSKKIDMAKEIIALMPPQFRFIGTINETVVKNEKFGIKDQGATIEHQYTFFERTDID